MKTVRKIDYSGQLILATLTILSVPFLLLPGFMAGLFIMGCWQLISASLNTTSFIHAGFKRHIFLYWMFCIGDIAFLLLSFWLQKFFNPDDTQVLTWIAMAGGVAIAGYYCKIYFKLIEFVALKNELAGLLKSK
jgi:hypothetical protein